MVSYCGPVVTTLRGKEGSTFTRRVEALEDREAQLSMACVAGNFKRGNERRL